MLGGEGEKARGGKWRGVYVWRSEGDERWRCLDVAFGWIGERCVLEKLEKV